MGWACSTGAQQQHGPCMPDPGCPHALALRRHQVGGREWVNRARLPFICGCVCEIFVVKDSCTVRSCPYTWGMADSERLELRVSPEWLELIDKARGETPRATWVKRMAQMGAEGALNPRMVIQAGSVSPQPVLDARSPEGGVGKVSRPRVDAPRSQAEINLERQQRMNKAKGL
jgi:hypothetical protein